MITIMGGSRLTSSIAPHNVVLIIVPVGRSSHSSAIMAIVRALSRWTDEPRLIHTYRLNTVAPEQIGATSVAERSPPDVLVIITRPDARVIGPEFDTGSSVDPTRYGRIRSFCSRGIRRVAICSVPRLIGIEPAPVPGILNVVGQPLSGAAGEFFIAGSSALCQAVLIRDFFIW